MKYKIDNLKVQQNANILNIPKIGKQNKIKTVKPNLSPTNVNAITKFKLKTQALINEKVNKRRYTLGEVIIYLNKVETFFQYAKKKRKEKIKKLSLRDKSEYDKQERILELQKHLQQVRNNIVKDNGKQIGRNPTESILNRDYTKRIDTQHLLELIKPLSEKEGHRYWQNHLRNENKIEEPNPFLQGIKKMISI